MGSYFVVLHSTPSEGGDSRKKFIQELAKKLGRKEQDINILLTDLPAVVTASPTKDFAQSLCQLIDDLGGLAEMMAEVSGIHAAIGAANTASGSERPAFKTGKNGPPAKKDDKAGPPKQTPRLTPAKEPNLRFASGDHFRTMAKLSQEEKQAETAPPAAPKISLEYAAVEPAKPTPEKTEKKEAASSAPAPLVSELSLPKLDDVEKLLDEALNGPTEAVAAPAEPAPEAAPAAAAQAEAEKEEINPETAQPKKTKSRSSLAVISAFGQKGEGKKTKSSAKWPTMKAAPKPKSSSAKNETLPVASAGASPSPVAVEVEPELEVEAEAPAPKKPGMPRKKKILFGVFGTAAVLYIALLIEPELLFKKDTGVSISMNNINSLLKEQDKILKDMKNRPAADRLKDVLSWKAEEVSGAGSLRVMLGSNDGIFESGTLELTTPPAPPLNPEEFTKGLKPRAWIKDLVVEKLRKDINSDQLSGKAKITLADERSLDKIVASTVITLKKSDNPEVISGTIEVFFPGITPDHPKENTTEKDGEGQARIYHKREFTARMVAPEEKLPPTRAKGNTKKGKPLPVMPVI